MNGKLEMIRKQVVGAWSRHILAFCWREWGKIKKSCG